MPDGTTPAVAPELAWFQTTKVNYQMSASSRIVGFRMWNHKYDTSNLSQFIPWNSRGGLTTFDNTEKVEWQKTYGNNLVTSMQYGFWQYHSDYWTFAPPGTPTTIDQITRQQTGAVGTPGQRPYNPRHRDGGDLKCGRTSSRESRAQVRVRLRVRAFGQRYPDLDPTLRSLTGVFIAATYNYQLILRSGVPFQMAVYSPRTRGWFQIPISASGRLVDQVTADVERGRPLRATTGRFRLVHGNCVRVANQTYPATCYAHSSSTSGTDRARLYAAWRVNGSKTVIKGWPMRASAHARPETEQRRPAVRTTTTYTGTLTTTSSTTRASELRAERRRLRHSRAARIRW